MQLLNFIVAEDIRQEIGNKFSIMGVFGDDIILNPAPNDIPANLRLGIYIRAKVEDGEQVPDKFCLNISLDEIPLGEAEGGFQQNGEVRSLTIALPIPQLPIAKLGILKFNYFFSCENRKILTGFHEIPIKSLDKLE